MSKETTISTAKVFKSGNTSLVVVLPQELVDKYHVQEGTKFLVKTDETNSRIIYEFMEAKD